MKNLLIATRDGRTEAGQSCRLRCYILTELVETGGVPVCESYGICVTAESAPGVCSACVRHITPRADEIFRLAGKLVEQFVTPVTLRDVVEDWIAAA